MSGNDAPVRFELSLNGERKATGGTEYGFLHVSVHREARHPEKDKSEFFSGSPRFDEEKWLQEKIEVYLGGSDSVADEQLTWVSQAIGVGDEIVIRVQGPGAVDSPTDRKASPKTRKAQSQNPENALSLDAAQKEYDAAMDTLLDNMDAPQDAFIEHVYQLTEASNKYCRAAMAASETEEGDDWKLLHIMGEDLPRRTSAVVGTVQRYRKRKAERSAGECQG